MCVGCDVQECDGTCVRGVIVCRSVIVCMWGE